jgi:ABC-type dipeptide/oligopeptide/nickel transport system permease subunit
MEHWMGVDQLGRDVMSRIIFGSRIALGVSICAVGLGAALGVPIGLLAAYFRGWTDSILMRFMDAIISFPGLILAMGLAAILGAEWYNLVIAIGVGNIPWIARVVRSQALSVCENDYILAAQTVGARSPRILARYIWPNSTAPVIVQVSVGMAWAVLVEAGLSFLGVGVRPPTPTWGSMLQFAFPVLKREPWLSIAPGTAIFLLVLAFNFVGDALRDVLDPRLKGVIH